MTIGGAEGQEGEPTKAADQEKISKQREQRAHGSAFGVRRDSREGGQAALPAVLDEG
jgi:hypothetical protein